MAKLYIIRHAMVNVVPDVPPNQWHLSEEGLSLTTRLASTEDWSDIKRIYHSPEHKTRETARVIANIYGVGMYPENDLRELKADIGFLHNNAFYNRVGAYLEGKQDSAFEDYEDATSRIVNCVQRIAKKEQGHPVAIVSHGRILVALFSHVLGRRLTQSEWMSIGFPDFSVVDTDTWVIKRGFLANSTRMNGNSGAG